MHENFAIEHPRKKIEDKKGSDSVVKTSASNLQYRSDIHKYHDIIIYNLIHIIYILTYICVYIYVYIYIEREREIRSALRFKAIFEK